MGSPSVNKRMFGATIPKSYGSQATILNSTALKPPLAKNKSPFLTGRKASLK